MKLWGGRFVHESNSFFKKFNSSIQTDYKLVEQDIFSSMSWADALLKSGVLIKSECNEIKNALQKLLCIVKKTPNIVLDSNLEDVHSWVETQLILLVGDLGKKLHTGRSRNDQIATDLKLWCKHKIKDLFNRIIEFKIELIKISDNTQSVIMPGYTHLQRAQPITFSFWCLAYLEMIKRDEDRLKDALKRLNSSPLGCGAISGTTWNIDRENLAKSMGFKSATNNSLDSVSDRDYVVELASVASISMMHLSRFAEDLIFFNSSESKFVELSDTITSGSSLMPQKKNPDSLELIRAKSGRVFGFLVSILVVLKGLPLSYNKDMQEDKKGLFDALNTWSKCLFMSSLVLKNLHINSINCLKASKKSYSNATELADYLVNKGITFRDAHHITGQIVLEALKLNVPLEKLDLSIFKKYSSSIELDVYNFLDVISLLEKRNSKGGVAPKIVSKAIICEKKQLKI
ncbi:argininosuccinate lyase [Buchnera aphidicola str. Bp (Baizongia pistaciae)]|uniref:Argininosuccinate lyase n=1 Tax=Buchnera aphidicola subsp. Baizongia pistaciae (strain Bp) TaxID=224915 RepID=ARLY_BUCBP|nr:argininosuccinate lyase [Buchnera aphidicola]P59614.1 RecName: Full=Argininosuccinate lyase; Short=ASAL; AltName: Full=Arginosuccinase [Buchnera aphidicola str. Bp (Baizongia pistaciae)]AAO26788.1 argininosuccinate lyase [Buchnera aphidicola str. Bp (Baizongia pistaciae)]